MRIELLGKEELIVFIGVAFFCDFDGFVHQVFAGIFAGECGQALHHLGHARSDGLNAFGGAAVEQDKRCDGEDEKWQNAGRNGTEDK